MNLKKKTLNKKKQSFILILIALFFSSYCNIHTNLTSMVSGAPEIIVDNSEAVFVGSWYTSTYYAGYWEENYKYNAMGTGSDKATFDFTIPKAGKWEVFAWWTSAGNRASNAPYTVNHAGGSTTVRVNQKINGGTWYSLGVYSFDAGSGSVVLSDDANGYVAADAVKLDYISQTTTYRLIIDTASGGTTTPRAGSYNHVKGSVVDVTASPNSGYDFSHWKLDGVKVGANNPYSVVMDDPHTLKPVFSKASTSTRKITANQKGANFYMSWSEPSHVPDNNRFATLAGFDVSASAGCKVVMFGLNPDFWQYPRYRKSLATFVERCEILGMGYIFKIQAWGDASARFSTPGSNYKIAENPRKREASLDFWRDIAEIYGGRPLFLGINPLCEPYSGSDYSKWNLVIKYYYDVIDNIRSIPGAEKTWVYVQAPYHWGGMLTPWLEKGIINRPNVGYEYHKFFETRHWKSYRDTYLRGKYKEGRDLMEKWHSKNIKPFLDAYPNLTVFCGEFGPLTDEAGYQQAMRDQTDIMNQLGIPWTVMFMKDDYDGRYEQYCYLKNRGTALNKWGQLLDILWD